MLPLPPLAGNTPGSSGQNSTAFGNFYSSFSGMGDPFTQTGSATEPWEKELLSKMDPTVAGAFLLSRKREDVYNDPQRLRELMGVYGEFREKEAKEASKIALQRQLLADIPATIRDVGRNLAQFSYNAPRLQILANIPSQMTAAYGAMPNIDIPRSVSFR
jgi:hypothetical protein